MIQTYIKDDNIVIRLDFESLDIFTAVDLKIFLYKIPIEKNEKVVLDIENLTYLDSSGLGLIISFWRNLKNKNSSIALANGRNKVKDVLEMTNVGNMIPYFDSLDEAIKSKIE